MARAPPYLEAHMRSINGNGDGAHSCHGNLKIVLALGLDVHVAAQSSTDIGSAESAFLILKPRNRIKGNQSHHQLLKTHLGGTQIITFSITRK